MEHATRDPHATVRPTGEQLERLLGAQLGRLRRRFLVHGTGWLLAALAGIAIVYYLADRTLDLPASVRLLLSLVLLGYVLYCLRRRIVYPLTRAFGRDDVALAIERTFPELRERLISAVQLNDMARGELRNQSPEMVERVVDEAQSEVRRIRIQRFLDPGRTLRVWGLAGAGGLVVALGVAQNADATAAFLQRMLGLDVAYPRMTTLHVELPTSGQDFQIERSGRYANVTVASGADLPVLIRVEGTVPRDVSLMVEGGRGIPPRVAATARSERLFRHVFRRIRSGFEFHAAGGDDPRGDLQVTVRTVRPPRVGTIRATLAYPAYTGREPITQSGGAIEALVGTRVQLQLTATDAVGEGRIAFLETGDQVPLSKRTVSDDEGSREVWTASFTVAKSDRYQVELVSPDGLNNPHPGTYPIVAVADHAPVGRVLLPSDDQLNVVLPVALLALRAEARDDYGLTAVRAEVRLSKSEQTSVLDVLPPAPAGADAPKRQRAVLTELLEVGGLGAEGAKVAIGDTIELGLDLVDNRSPEPQTTKVPPRRVLVVGATDLARRIAGHFRRIRGDVERIFSLQTDRRERLAGVLDDLQSGTDRAELRTELTVVHVGQARLQSTAERIHVELMRSFNAHLFNRLEDSPHATAVAELYLRYHRERDDARGFVAEFYDMLGAERKAGRIGSMPKTLDPILTMIGSCSAVADRLAPDAVELLDRAAVERDDGAAVRVLQQVAARQDAILEQLEALRAKLDEWNVFQDVITHARSILDRQRDVQLRTRDKLDNPGKKEKR